MNYVGDIYEYGGYLIEITEVNEETFFYRFKTATSDGWREGDTCNIKNWLQPDGSWSKFRVSQGHKPFSLPEELFEV